MAVILRPLICPDSRLPALFLVNGLFTPSARGGSLVALETGSRAHKDDSIHGRGDADGLPLRKIQALFSLKMVCVGSQIGA